MSNNAAWLVLSFAIMAVAVLATLYETFEGLAKRLSRLGAGGEQTAEVHHERRDLRHSA